MKKGMIKACVLIAVFIIGILGFGQLTNYSNEDLTTEMAGATLPIVSLYMGETEVNELHGYVNEMNAIYMRDTITPVNKERILPIKIQTYNKTIKKISYEIRSLDTTRLISSHDVEEYDETSGQILADLEIQNLLEQNEEYLLQITLSSGKKNYYYYTRIMETENCNSEECVAFAMEFHDKSFDSEKASELATYMEPNATGDNTTLNKVTINSSLKQVSWADFVGEQLTTPVPSIKEINDSYNVVILDYLVSSTGENGEMEYYNVEEYYRVRYTNDRMYLLSFERTMNQIFRAENQSFYENYIQLGIRDQNVEYAANEKGDIVAFVQEGELWCFNENTNQLAQVFSFIGNEGIDSRENYGEHDIKIISIDETGSVNFVVYGYMNCGNHEGEVGICVYHYDSVANTIEEELFIPSTESYQIMKADLGQLMYANTQGIFFIMLDGTVYRIDLATMQMKEYITGLVSSDSYAIADSHKYFAWTDGSNEYAATKIYVVNLDTEERKEINADGGTYIRTLGFMEDDLVYGVADQSMVLVDTAGNTVYPMKQIVIANAENLEHLKEYQKDGFYIADIDIEDYIMYLNRVQYNGMAYVEAQQDTIMNREGDSKAIVDIHTNVTEQKETQVQLTMAEVVKEASPKILTPKHVVVTEERQVTLETKERGHNYYAYARGDVIYVSDSLPKTISAANTQMGVVIGDQQQYIWKRARKSVQNRLDVQVGSEDAAGSSIAKCVSAMLERENINISVTALLDQGKTPKEILETTMQDVTAVDLTGCTLEETFYYISLGTPVFAMKSNTDAVLLTGYDSSSISFYDAATEKTEKMPMDEAATMFADAGNIFFGYMK